MNDKIKNLKRFWVDVGSGWVIRGWTNEEYKTQNPKEHIFEKHWGFYCATCGTMPQVCLDKRDSIHRKNIHRKRHLCYSAISEYMDFELKCHEFFDEFVEEYNCWVAKHRVY